MVGGVAQAMAELAGLFGWAADEEVLESFACALLQTYGCQHNAFTPPREAGPSLLQFVCHQSTRMWESVF